MLELRPEIWLIKNLLIKTLLELGIYYGSLAFSGWILRSDASWKLRPLAFPYPRLPYLRLPLLPSLAFPLSKTYYSFQCSVKT